MSTTRSSLLLRLSEGADESDWSQFVELYRPLIAQAVHAAGIRSADQDDVIQNVLLQLLRVFPKFVYQRERGFFRHWLRRVARNQARDLQRRSRQIPLPMAEIDATARELEADREEEKQFRLQLMQAGIARIRCECREKVWLSFAGHRLEGRRSAEVARTLGITENAVNVACTRALGILRDFCAFHGEELSNDPPLFN